VRALLSDASRDLLLIELRSVKAHHWQRVTREQQRIHWQRVTREQPNEFMSSHIIPIEAARVSLIKFKR
jgi:hypothetical protein